MSKQKLTFELNPAGLIDAQFIGSLQTVISMIVDVMEQNEEIRVIVLSAAEIFENNESQD